MFLGLVQKRKSGRSWREPVDQASDHGGSDYISHLALKCPGVLPENWEDRRTNWRVKGRKYSSMLVMRKPFPIAYSSSGIQQNFCFSCGHTQTHTDTHAYYQERLSANMNHAHSATHTKHKQPRGLLLINFTAHINHCFVKTFTNSVTIN